LQEYLVNGHEPEDIPSTSVHRAVTKAIKRLRDAGRIVYHREIANHNPPMLIDRYIWLPE
jgi:hypothetical protein